MTPAELAVAVLDAARQVCTARGFDGAMLPDSTQLDRPRNRQHGDYSSTIALRMASQFGVAAFGLAADIAAELAAVPGIKSVEAAGAGFLNITLEPDALDGLLAEIVRAGRDYGRCDLLAGQKVNLEYVSADPTRPVHLGHARWAAMGDSLARVLTAVGAEVTREHYNNDVGSRVTRFAEALWAAAAGEPLDELDRGYAGEYVEQIAEQVMWAHPGALDLPRNRSIALFEEEGRCAMLTAVAASLERFHIGFDVWFSGRTLCDGGAVERAVAALQSRGHVFGDAADSGDAADPGAAAAAAAAGAAADSGALWLRTTRFGTAEDHLLRQADGKFTDFAVEAAYYMNKRSRGFDRCLYLVGGKQGGYADWLPALAACCGDAPDRTLGVLVGKPVTLGGTRVGNETLLTLDELVRLVGVDAARYCLVRMPVDAPLILDLDLITSNVWANPGFAVCFAAARAAGVLRAASEICPTWDGDCHPDLLSQAVEVELLKVLGGYPAMVVTAAELCEPHRVARYLEALADLYHGMFEDGECPVLPKGAAPVTEAMRARLWLTAAVRVVMVSGLGLLGVSAPERI